MASLHEKANYLMHIRNLKEFKYLRSKNLKEFKQTFNHGLVLKKLDRVIKFKQKVLVKIIFW